MAKLDRLSALIARFELKAEVACDLNCANLFLLSDAKNGELNRIVFWPIARDDLDDMPVDGELMVAASIDLGGKSNPLARALPSRVTLSIDEESNLKDLAQLIIGEIHEQRCGQATTLQKLFEVMVIIMLRKVMRQHADNPGLIAGLADERLSKALVAIHEKPEFDWRVEDLADTAGLSRSQFMQRFKARVGHTPAQYLRDWRLSLARQDLEKGDRVKVVAQRYCYGSQEALSRAFNQRYQCSPAQVRKTQA
ncbi:AraC family transcriptional regulator [Vibrio sp. DW001]|uniref:AraC family transcriptional regulator n=1 Tax=Vibrio sp. DW001 TaxID=2912315 RepID=UPI0023AF8B54|nr:AraC family transcriptional regulator [Vibrio sp. DW001]WED28946.1 AraC family transcriptional regulator [Vibrio sp. DW001]